MERTMFSFDRHIFNILLCLTLFFMICYAIGTSVPAWFVAHELRVTNLSTCESAHPYVGAERLFDWSPEPTDVEVYASLWFLKLRLRNSIDAYQVYLPFASLPITGYKKLEHHQDSVSEWIFSGSFMSLVIGAFLISGLVFSFRASTRPARIIYYGLSSLSIVTGLSIWVSTAIHSSQSHVISLMSDLCLQNGAISTSVYLQVATGSAAILSFIFGCILIHIAVVINTRFSALRDIDDVFTVSRMSYEESDKLASFDSSIPFKSKASDIYMQHY